MIQQEESRNCIEMKDKYIITPQLSWWNRKDLDKKIKKDGKKFLLTLSIQIIKIIIG